MKFEIHFKLRVPADSSIPGVYDSEIRRFYRYVARISPGSYNYKPSKVRLIKRRIMSSLCVQGGSMEEERVGG